MKADGEELVEAVMERKRGKAKQLIMAKANVGYTNVSAHECTCAYPCTSFLLPTMPLLRRFLCSHSVGPRSTGRPIEGFLKSQTYC